jgi:hypothetical protein
MNQFRLQYIYMKMSEENQGTDIITQQKCNFFTKMENRRAEQVLSGRLVAVGGGCGKWV